MLFKGKLGLYSSHLKNYIKTLNDGDLSVLACIFCTFAENSKESKLKAAKALASVINKWSFEDVCRIDVQMRQTTSMEWSINWRVLHVQDFVTTRMSADEERAVFTFASFNPNGYIRQQAVELLTIYESTLPAIILRLNDWVYEVRQSALNSFTKRIGVATSNEILYAFPFLEKLRRSKREEYAFAFDRLCDRVAKDKTILISGLSSKNIMTRKLCIYLLAETTLSNPQVLADHIKREKDPFLRRLVFQVLLKMGVDGLTLAHKFLNDKCPANRMMALQYLDDRHQVIEDGQQLLLDRNSAVRSLARDILKETVGDFHNFYLNHLNDNLACAILGLGEVGTQDDCRILEKYLDHQSVSVVRASMVSLMRLDAKKYGSWILDKLPCEHPGVVKTAAVLIKKYAAYDYDKIFEIYQTCGYGNTKMKCASLLFSSPKWQHLRYILLLLDSGYEPLQSVCTVQIDRWIHSYNNSYAVISNELKDQIKKLIALRKNSLSEKTKKQLLFYLG